jgi:hypothetical protein
MASSPSGWDDWFLDLIFAGIGGIGLFAFSFAVFLIRMLIKRELDRLNATLSGIQVAMKEFTAIMQTKLDNHEHRLSMLEGFYYRPDGSYIGPERRRSQAQTATTMET